MTPIGRPRQSKAGIRVGTMPRRTESVELVHEKLIAEKTLPHGCGTKVVTGHSHGAQTASLLLMVKWTFRRLRLLLVATFSNRQTHFGKRRRRKYKKRLLSSSKSRIPINRNGC